MRKVAFIIDGWFMRKRIAALHTFKYTGVEIRKYCCKHLETDDEIYRIFYYDTKPLEKKGLHPLTQKTIDFKETYIAKQQYALLDSIKKTPNFALRFCTPIG